MIIHYTTEEQDYLTHQLFVASKSELIRKKRTKTSVFVPIIYIALGLFALFLEDLVVGIAFIIVAVLWRLIYPVWDRQNYIRHYKNFIQEHFKDRFGKEVTLVITDDFISAKDESSEGKVASSSITEINEIPQHILIRIKGGQSFILPKSKISNIDELKARLRELAALLQIPYTNEENWTWK